MLCCPWRASGGKSLEGSAKLAMPPHRLYLQRGPIYRSGGMAGAFVMSLLGEEKRDSSRRFACTWPTAVLVD